MIRITPPDMKGMKESGAKILMSRYRWRRTKSITWNSQSRADLIQGTVSANLGEDRDQNGGRDQKINQGDEHGNYPGILSPGNIFIEKDKYPQEEGKYRNIFFAEDGQD